MELTKEQEEKIHEALKNVKGDELTTVTLSSVVEINFMWDIVIRQFQDIAASSGIKFKRKRKLKFVWKFPPWKVTDSFKIEGKFNDVLPFVKVFNKKFNENIAFSHTELHE